MINDRRKAAAKSLGAFFGTGPAQDLSPELRAAVAKLKAAARPRDTRVADMLLAGRYRYIDFPGAQPVEVRVDWIAGDCIVTFPPLDGDDGAELLAADISGRFERIESQESQPRAT